MKEEDLKMSDIFTAAETDLNGPATGIVLKELVRRAKKRYGRNGKPSK